MEYKQERYNAPFPTRLRGLIEDRHVTRKALAAAMKVTPQAVSAYTNGLMTPTLENLCAVADFFNVSVDYLIGRTDISDFSSDTVTYRSVRAFTGLSYGAIKLLHDGYEHPFDKGALHHYNIMYLSRLIESPAFKSALDRIQNLVNLQKADAKVMRDESDQMVRDILQADVRSYASQNGMICFEGKEAQALTKEAAKMSFAAAIDQVIESNATNPIDTEMNFADTYFDDESATIKYPWEKTNETNNPWDDFPF